MLYRRQLHPHHPPPFLLTWRLCVSRLNPRIVKRFSILLAPVLLKVTSPPPASAKWINRLLYCNQNQFCISPRPLPSDSRRRPLRLRPLIPPSPGKRQCTSHRPPHHRRARPRQHRTASPRPRTPPTPSSRTWSASCTHKTKTETKTLTCHHRPPSGWSPSASGPTRCRRRTSPLASSSASSCSSSSPPSSTSCTGITTRSGSTASGPADAAMGVVAVGAPRAPPRRVRCRRGRRRRPGGEG
ncbi:hypothetical protein B0H67DRAFT_351183 [Lasiosphaeris hirsuta]|uniref:Uncharacterized protein n=1 Tax=Lasiosphaeris hirsuta TaxID=260670 RepID=A0AA39ZVL6_9PEZI|nr:hypothetical protein B0H67DRAFT_351183 [Lasiosphaeris hirsuta]